MIQLSIWHYTPTVISYQDLQVDRLMRPTGILTYSGHTGAAGGGRWGPPAGGYRQVVCGGWEGEERAWEVLLLPEGYYVQHDVLRDPYLTPRVNGLWWTE